MGEPWLNQLPVVLAVIDLALFAVVAWSDIAVRRIPDFACIGVLLTGMAQQAGHGIEALGLSMLAAVVVFGVLLALHARHLLGGGDVKLLAASAAGFSPLGLVRFVTAVALIGGVLAVAHLLLRRWVPPAAVAPARGSVLRRVFAVERWRIGRRASMPYGVAIAGGGAWMILAGLGG